MVQYIVKSPIRETAVSNMPFDYALSTKRELLLGKGLHDNNIRTLAINPLDWLDQETCIGQVAKAI